MWIKHHQRGLREPKWQSLVNFANIISASKTKLELWMEITKALVRKGLFSYEEFQNVMFSSR